MVVWLNTAGVDSIKRCRERRAPIFGRYRGRYCRAWCCAAYLPRRCLGLAYDGRALVLLCGLAGGGLTLLLGCPHIVIQPHRFLVGLFRVSGKTGLK